MTNNPPQRNIFTRIFISSPEPRLRAGWRLLIQTLMMISIGLGLSLLVGIFTFGKASENIGMLIGQIVELLTITGSVFLARWLLDRRSIPSLGLKLDHKVLPDLLVGIAIPFVMMGLVFLVEYALGWLTLEGFAWESLSAGEIATGLLGAFIVFIFVGWNEELMSRGYHLQTLASGLNLFWGILISSAVFGVLHLGNPNATWVSAAGILFAGIFLAYGLTRTRQLWLPIGLHIGWNFFEGPFFGFPVSGLDTFRLIRITVTGPVLWTGGKFGPESGLIVLPALIVGAILIHLYTRKRENLAQID